MPKLLLVSDRLREGDTWEVGDIIQWLSDEVYAKQMAGKGLDEFDVVDTMLTQESFNLLRPQVKRYYKSKTLEWTEEPPEEIECWKDSGGNFKRIETKPKHILRYDSGIISETYSRYSENSTTIVDKDGKVIG
jgi:hypothetical protein